VSSSILFRFVLAAATLAAGVVLLVAAGHRPAAPALVATASGDLSLGNSRDGQAVLTARDLAPGASTSGTLTLSNHSANERELLLGADVADRPGRRGGSLSAALGLRVERLNADAPVLVYEGRLDELSDVALDRLAPKSGQRYRLTATLPESGPGVDDAFAGSALEVGLRWHAKSLGGDDEVDEPTTTGPRPPVAPLPRPAPRPENGPVAPAAQEPRVTPFDELLGPGSGGAGSVRVWFGGRRSVSLRRNAFTTVVACRPACSVRATVRVRIGPRWRTLRTRRIGRAEATRARRLAVRLRPREWRMLRGALRHRGPLRVKVTLSAAASGHAVTHKTRSLRLRR
jgi:hypothetical protein